MISTAVSLSDCLTIPREDFISAAVGLVAGYPVRLYIEHSRRHTLTVAFYLIMPACPAPLFWRTWRQRVTMDVAIRVSGRGTWKTRTVQFGDQMDIANLFEWPWEKVVREGSPQFPDGTMKIEAKFRMADPFS